MTVSVVVISNRIPAQKNDKREHLQWGIGIAERSGIVELDGEYIWRPRLEDQPEGRGAAEETGKPGQLGKGQAELLHLPTTRGT